MAFDIKQRVRHQPDVQVEIAILAALHAGTALAFQADALSDLPVLPMASVETACYLRLQAQDRPGVLADVTRILADRDISIEALVQKEPAPGASDVPIILLTYEVQEQRMNAAIAAIQALKAQGVAHPRIVGLIETCEESGSGDLLPYVDALRARLGDVGLVICLDSGAGNYDQLWLTTSLRGMASGVLKVEILTEGIHSGDASGLVPSSFRIMRQVLDRLEDSATGRLLPGSFHCEVPAERLEQARATAAILGDEVYKRFPWAHHDCGGATVFALPTTTEPVEALLNRTWRPTLSVTGAEGFPALKDAGNVLRPYTAFKLSLRLPPLVDAPRAVQELKALLEDNAPYQAKVTFEAEGGATGWNAPAITPWFDQALRDASQAAYGAGYGTIGQGGTIPLMNMLSQGFPTAQMMVCGVLGPRSNAHGPNEFLHLDYARRLTASVAQVIARMP